MPDLTSVSLGPYCSRRQPDREERTPTQVAGPGDWLPRRDTDDLTVARAWAGPPRRVGKEPDTDLTVLHGSAKLGELP